MNSRPATAAAELDGLLAAAADPSRADAMAAYMQNHFAFYGVPSADRRRLSRSWLNDTRTWSANDVLTLAETCWRFEHREVQYVGLDAIVRRKKRLAGRDDLDRVEGLIRHRAWWDTVDLLAAHPVGQLVYDDRSLVTVMDTWIDQVHNTDDMWIVRSAILHQLNWGADTDAIRLFGYVDRCADSTEFFIRKACGWALRTYARVSPEAVESYVDSRRGRLSGLTVREALKHLR